ncbi:MAG TPA: hypothetical protein VM510_16045 [Caulifigura sp.]|jgi:hypothetical protein|nr:hypothetical protein [Caulifigura sp.]
MAETPPREATLYDLTPEQLAKMGDRVDEQLKFLEASLLRLRELNFNREDSLYWHLDKAERAMKRLSQTVRFYANPASRNGSSTLVSRPMTAGEFIAENQYVVATVLVFNDAGKTTSYRVAIAADTPSPIPADTPGVRIREGHWTGGPRDRADLAGRMFAYGGIELRADMEAWLVVRTRAAELGHVDPLPGAVPGESWRSA